MLNYRERTNNRWCACGDEILIEGDICEVCKFMDRVNREKDFCYDCKMNAFERCWLCYNPEFKCPIEEERKTEVA